MKLKDLKIMLKMYGFMVMFLLGMIVGALIQSVALAYTVLIGGMIAVTLSEWGLLRLQKKLKGYDTSIIGKKYTYIDEEGNYKVHNDDIYEALSKLAYYEHEVEEN